MIDFFDEVIFHEIFCYLFGIAQALQPTIHIAGIAEIAQPNKSLPSPITPFREVKTLQHRSLLIQMTTLELTFLPMSIPIFLLALPITVLHRFALAELEILSFATVVTFVHRAIGG